MTDSFDRAVSNPYVGPRTFTEKEGRFFFGREREARDLTARIVSERLLLFYAQSGAGKSSLLNARVIPKLRDEDRFQVLPVGRVSGDLPASVAQVDNIYAFNLMTSLDQSDASPARLAQVTLSDFLDRLARETTVNDDGQRVARWVYKPELAAEQAAAGEQAVEGPRFALVIDQFEEIITAHPGRWREREAFFRQLNQALLDDPNLWVVLALREDYVAALDPYAELTFNRLRARFYMERMQASNGLEAVRRPAELGGRPFGPGVAEQLVDELRQVRVPGRDDTIPGQYVEPVQLQVVCYQLWERLGERAGEPDETPISFEDLAEAGDVNQALEQFYAETLAAVLAEKGVHEAGVSERGLRTWFDKELITETGIRNTVFRNEAAGRTGSMPNVAVDALVRRFLLRTELRGGGAWVELVHDRFVEPIRASNTVWFPLHLSALQRQAALWEEQGRSSGLLLRDEALAEAEAWAAEHADELEPYEQDFLAACREARRLAEVFRRRAIALAALVGAIGLLLFLVGMLALNLNAQRITITDGNKELAEVNKRLAEVNIALTESNIKLTVERNRAVEAEAIAVAAERRAIAERSAFESVMLARLISRLDLGSEDQRQFALLLSQEAMAISHTLPAESASIEVLDAAYRNSGQWQPVTTPTLMFTESLALPFSSPLTMTLSRDGNTVAAVETGPTVMIARGARGWVTETVSTSFARITALALSDDGGRIAVAGCGERTEVVRPLPPRGEATRECGNWRIEILSTSEGSQFRRVVKDGVDNRVVAMAFHPKLMHLVAATVDDTLRNWRFSAAEPVAQHVTGDTQRDVVDLSVSPDGMYLAVLDQRGRNTVWSWNTWVQLEDSWPSYARDSSFRSVSFLHGGEWFASGSDCPDAQVQDRSSDPCPAVRLWDKETLTPIGKPFAVSENILDVGFDEQTDILTVLGSHRMVRWNLNTEDWRVLACQSAGRDMTYYEWSEAFPNQDVTKFEGICGFPLHPSFVEARIDQASLKLEDCIPQGTQAGLDLLEYQDIDPSATATSILLNLALDRFEPDEDSHDVISNSPATACLDQANYLRLQDGLPEIPPQEAFAAMARLLDAESKLSSNPGGAMRDLDEVRRQLMAWSVDLDSRLAADYQGMCFDQAYADACDAARNLGLDALITYGETKEGEISQNLEGAPWYFWGSRGDAVTIAMDAVGDSFDTLLTLDGAGGRSGLAQNDDYVEGSYNSRITDFVLSDDGLYRIRPQAFSGQGAFRLTLQKRDLPEIHFGVPVTSSTSESGSWTFGGKAGQTVTVDLEYADNGKDPHLTLKRAGDDRPIAESSDSDRIVSLVLPSDDIYIVTVGSSSESVPFSLTVSLLEP